MKKRIVALILCIVMVLSSQGVCSLAYVVNDAEGQIIPTATGSEESLVIRTPNGDVEYDETWEELYPYGTFAFGDYQADVAEGGPSEPDGENIPEKIVLPVYRVGGTKGKATVKIQYSPAATTISEDGQTVNYDYAASATQDLVISYENPISAASGQAFGIAPMIADNDAKLELNIIEENDENVSEDGTDIRLAVSGISVPETADVSYQWQVGSDLYIGEDGNIYADTWDDILEACDSEIIAGYEDIFWINEESGEAGWAHDYRMLYTVNDNTYCTKSLLGNSYVSEGVLSEITILEYEYEEPTYSTIDFGNEFDSYEFEITFAENEWVKNIIIEAVDDNINELDELGIFTIVGCKGGVTSELCNTCTLMVSDNESKGDSKIGFEVTEISADQDDGYVNVTVKRTGDTMYPVSVDYSTLDMTAKAGYQYAETNGFMSFVGSVSEVTVRIPLIAENERSESLNFALVLSNIKGGTEDKLCSFEDEKSLAVINLVSSGKAQISKEGLNPESIMAMHDGTDVSSLAVTLDDSLVSDGKTTTVISDDVSDMDTVWAEHVESAIDGQVYSGDGSWGLKFKSTNQNPNYWGEHAYLVGGESGYRLESDITEAKNKDEEIDKTPLNKDDNYYGECSNSWKNGVYMLRACANTDNAVIMSKGDAYKHSGYMFSDVSMKTHVDTSGVAKNKKSKVVRYARPTAEFEVYGYRDLGIFKGDMYYSILTTKHTKQVDGNGNFVYVNGNGAYYEKAKTIDFDATKMKVNAYIEVYDSSDNTEPLDDDVNTNGKTKFYVDEVALKRRVFNNSTFKLNLYTDADSLDNKPLSSDTYNLLYNSVQVGFKTKEGGANQKGQIYVGSTIFVKLNKLLNYEIATFDKAEDSVYLTKKDGNKVAARVEATEDGTYYITMLWDEMEQSDISDEYTLNLVLTSKQTICVDISSSTNGEEYEEAWKEFFTKTDEKAGIIKYSYNKLDPASKFIDCTGQFPTAENEFKYPTDKKVGDYCIAVPAKDSNSNSNSNLFIYNVDNVKSVNLGQDEDDLIIFNQKVYKGNDTINITEADLNNSKLTFYFYDSKFLSKKSTMKASIDHVDLYFDKDGDGKLDENELLKPRLDVDRAENEYAPYEENGKIYQYYFKVYFSMNYKCINTPPGEDSTATINVVPYFTSGVTDETAEKKMTEQQKANRYIKGNNMTGFPMYLKDVNGNEILRETGLFYVDIPLGGDTSSPIAITESEMKYDKDDKLISSSESTKYVWEPKFVGNLIADFENPDAVTFQENITKSPVSIFDDDEINNYLGAFVDGSTYGLAVYDNDVTEKIDSECIESFTVGSLKALKSSLNVLNMEGTENNKQGAEAKEPEGENEYDAFSADLSVSMPSLNLGYGDYLNFSSNSNTFAISMGLPVYEKTFKSYSAPKPKNKDNNNQTTPTASDGNNTVDKLTNGNTTSLLIKDGKGNTTEQQTTEMTGDGGNTTEVKVTDKNSGQPIENLTKIEVKANDGSGNKVVSQTMQKSLNTNLDKKTLVDHIIEGVSDANSDILMLKDFIDSIGKNGKGPGFKNWLKNDGDYEKASGLTPQSACRSFSLSFQLQFAMIFEYNDVDDAWRFKSAAISATAGISFTVKYRFVSCPAVYVYVKIGLSLSLGIGLQCDRTIETVNNALKNVKLSDDKHTLEFTLNVSKKNGGVRGIRLNLSGKYNLEIFKGSEILSRGSVYSDGNTDVLMEDYDAEVRIVLTWLEGSKLNPDSIKGISGTDSTVHFNGVTVKPSFSIEAGVGVGVEILSVELYCKTNLAIEIVFGQYIQETKGYEPAYMSSFDWSLSLGLNIQCLFFNFSFDAIAMTVHGKVDPGNQQYDSEWTISFLTANGNYTIWEKTNKYKDGSIIGHSLEEDESADGAGAGLMRISGPQDVSGNVQFASANESAINQQAYNPTDLSAPFQLSGYNTSSDAKTLVKGLGAGYSYKLFKANGENYILYPISTTVKDEAGSDVVVTRLVLSKLVFDETEDTNRTLKGLVNPKNESDTVTYLNIDNDEYADIDFDVDVSGTNIYVSWTGYSEKKAYESPAEAAKNMLLKRTSFDTGTGNVSEPTEVCRPVSGSAVFLSNLSQVGKDTVFVKSLSDENTQANSLLKQYLIKVNGLTEEEIDTKNTVDASHVLALYHWNTQSELNKMYGSQSEIVFAGDDNTQTSIATLAAGTVVENIDTVVNNDDTYVVYTTAETVYYNQTESGTEAVETVENINENTELATIRRMYIRKIGDPEGPICIKSVVDYAKCTSDNYDKCILKDGEYVSSGINRIDDPLFSNIQFLRAKIDGTNNELVLLYELGGNTYMIREAEIKKMFNGETFNILPIFSQTTGTGVSINSDADGLMALVYVAPVSNTSNNAVYVAYWDAEANKFGAAYILAMNHLQVYEDAIKYNLSNEDQEKAYLGIVDELTDSDYKKAVSEYTDSRNKGDMDTLTFGNLQMTTDSYLYEGEEGATPEMRNRLVVLTEATLKKLTKKTFKKNAEDSGIEMVVPDTTTTDVGFYAIVFGNGVQKLTFNSIEFNSFDFSAGSSLKGTIRLSNTGTAAIRGSENNPITAVLKAGESQIAKWTIRDSIVPGEQRELQFDGDKLSHDLETNTEFRLWISEDSEYIQSTGGTAYSDEIRNLYILDERPELILENFTLNYEGIDSGKVRYNIDAWVGNHGNSDVDNVFAQLTYATGEKDEEGEDIYRPIDLTGSNIETMKQTQIISAQSITSNDLENGIVALRNEDDSLGEQSIKKGYRRQIKGTLLIPKECFISSRNMSGLHLRAEVFSDSDSLKDSLNYDATTKVYSSEHSGEYNSKNNVCENIEKHMTRFNVPVSITATLGQTLYIPVSFDSTVTESSISVSDVTDGTENWKARLGILYYDPSLNSIVMTPGKECADLIQNGQIPSGIIRVEDKNTNAVCQIKYKVNAKDSYINIYKDDSSYKFINADDSATDVNAAEINRDWDFGMLSEATNGDYCVALKDDAKISFNTVANSITLRFMGDVTILLDGSPLNEGSGSAEDKDSNTLRNRTWTFNNENSSIHMVTIVAKKDAVIDSYKATYSNSADPVPVRDGESPVVYVGRSMPDTSSISVSGTTTNPVKFTVYAIDNNGISTVSLDSKNVSNVTKTNGDTFASFEVEISENGKHNLVVSDISGNETITTFYVQWFAEQVAAESSAYAPELISDNIHIVDANGESVDISNNNVLTEKPYIMCNYVCEADETVKVLYSVTSDLAAATEIEQNNGKWIVENNGYYCVMVSKNSDETESWTRVIIPVDFLSRGSAGLSAGFDSTEKELKIAANVPNGIYELKVNGFNRETAVNTTSYNETVDIKYSGEYTVTLKDNAAKNSNLSDEEKKDHIKSITVNISNSDIPLTIDMNEISFTDMRNIIVSGNAVRGGAYDIALANNASSLNDYKASYQMALVKYEDRNQPEKASFKSFDLNGLQYNDLDYDEYCLLVKDSEGNIAESEKIGFYKQTVTSGEGYNVYTDVINDTILLGDDIVFNVDISGMYTKGKYFKVEVNGTTVDCDTTGNYVIQNVTSDIEIEVHGVMLDTDVSFEEEAIALIPGGKIEVAGNAASGGYFDPEHVKNGCRDDMDIYYVAIVRYDDLGESIFDDKLNESDFKEYLDEKVTFEGLEPGGYSVVVRSSKKEESTQYVSDVYYFYNVTLPKSKVYSVVTDEQVIVPEGDDFTFDIKLSADYVEGSYYEVSANGNALTRNTEGKYVIEDITEDYTISVKGVMYDVPVVLDENVISMLPGGTVEVAGNGATGGYYDPDHVVNGTRDDNSIDVYYVALVEYDEEAGKAKTDGLETSDFKKYFDETVKFEGLKSGSYCIVVRNIFFDEDKQYVSAPLRFFDMTLPESEAYSAETDCSMLIPEGRSFTFTVTPEEEYVEGNYYKVTANGKVVERNSNGKYVLDNVSDNTDIKVYGVMRDVPVRMDEEVISLVRGGTVVVEGNGAIGGYYDPTMVVNGKRSSSAVDVYYVALAEYDEKTGRAKTEKLTKDDFKKYFDETVKFENVTSGSYCIVIRNIFLDEEKQYISKPLRFFDVTLPESYMYKAVAEDSLLVPESENFTFSIVFDPEYVEGEKYTLKANDDILNKNENGMYVIGDIHENKNITVSGVKRDVPVVLDESVITANVDCSITVKGNGATGGYYDPTEVFDGKRISEDVTVYYIALAEYDEKTGKAKTSELQKSDFREYFDNTVTFDNLLSGRYCVVVRNTLLEEEKQAVSAPIDFYEVILPSSLMYTVKTDDRLEVRKGESVSFRVVINDGYVPIESYAVKANGKVVEPVQGIYSINDISENINITVEGVTSGYYYDVIPVVPENDNGEQKTVIHKTGDVISAKKVNGTFVVTANGSESSQGTVEYLKPSNPGVKKVVIPDTITVDGVEYKVTSIAEGAFRNNGAMKSLVIGNNVVTIGNNAFRNCDSLKTVTFGDNVTTVGIFAFKHCDSLTSVVFGKNVKKISSYAFSRCYKLKTVELDEGLKSIAKKAFYKCRSLESITIPSSVYKIGEMAFAGCRKLADIRIETVKLKASKMGANIFKNIALNAAFIVPAQVIIRYSRLINASGAPKGATVK